MFSIFLRAQDNLIIEMNMKCSKKTNRWAHLDRLLNFYISYHQPLLEYTRNKQPELMSLDQWWIITYAVAPMIDSINITLVQLQARSLLIA
jgi:lipase chaperone LimK